MHSPATVMDLATAESVLAALQERRREQCRCDAPDSNPDLCFETSVAEWRATGDAGDWRELGHALNREWRVEVTTAEWRKVLEPAEVHCMGEVCDLIARHSRRRHDESKAGSTDSWTSIGPFGASSMHDSWSDVSAVFPATPMPCCRSQADAFCANPDSAATNGVNGRPFKDALLWGALLGLLVLLVGVVAQQISNPWVALAGAGIFVACYGLHMIAGWCMKTR